MGLFGLTILRTAEVKRLEGDRLEAEVRLSRCQRDIQQLRDALRDTVLERDRIEKEKDEALAKVDEMEKKVEELGVSVSEYENKVKERDEKLLDMGKALGMERDAYTRCVAEKEEVKKAVIEWERKCKLSERKLKECTLRLEENKEENAGNTGEEEVNDEPITEETESPYKDVDVTADAYDEDNSWSPEGKSEEPGQEPLPVEESKEEKNVAKNEPRQEEKRKSNNKKKKRR